MDKVSNKPKQENENSRELHIQNEDDKKLVIKLGINPEDMEAIKIPRTKHAQTTEITQVEKDKEVHTRELMDRNKEIFIFHK